MMQVRGESLFLKGRKRKGTFSLRRRAVGDKRRGREGDRFASIVSKDETALSRFFTCCSLFWYNKSIAPILIILVITATSLVDGNKLRQK